MKRCRSDGKIGAFGKAPGAGRSNKLKYRLIFRYAAVWKRAIPALTAGIALFFTGCHAGLPPEKPRAADAALRQFEVAETCRAKGDLDRALAAYGRYLEQAPASGKAALAMERSAEIHAEKGAHEQALSLYRRLVSQNPKYPRLPVIRYRIARQLYLLARYRPSRDEAFTWLRSFPRHPLKARVLQLLGDDFSALGDNGRAFYWWLRAMSAWRADDAAGKAVLDRDLCGAIQAAGTEDLARMADFAAKGPYAPRIYYRLAGLFLEQGRFREAREAAMSLVRSTTEQSWVDRGRALLERAREALSVRPGVIGCLLPLSGPFAIYGEQVLNGIEEGSGILDDAAGGGGDLELVIRDSKANAEAAVAALEELAKTEKVMAVIGPISSRASTAVAVKAREIGVPVILLTQKEGVTGTGDMVFRNFLTPSREVARLLETAMERMGIRRFAILYPDNSYGRFYMNRFWDGLEERGGTVTAVASYSPDQTDFADQIKKMTGTYYPRPPGVEERLREMRTPLEEECIIYPDPPAPVIDFDAVFIPDAHERVAMIAPQLVFHDVADVQLLGTSLWQSPELIRTAGDYVQGALFPSGFFAASAEPCVRSFVQEYRSDFDADPGILAATGYDTIRFLKHVMDEGDIRTRKDFSKAMRTCRDFPGVTGNIVFDAGGEVEKEPVLLTISGRRMVMFR